LSRKRNVLLCGVSGGGVHVVDLDKKKEIHFLLNHELGIYDIKYSKSNDVFIMAGGDGRISIWDGTGYSFIKSITLCKEKGSLGLSRSIGEICFDRLWRRNYPDYFIGEL